MNSLIVENVSLGKALQDGMQKLNLALEEIEYQVLEKKSRGLRQPPLFKVLISPKTNNIVVEEEKDDSPNSELRKAYSVNKTSPTDISRFIKKESVLEIKIKKNGVYIRVNTKKSIDMSKVLRALTERGVAHYDRYILWESIEKPDGFWHKIASYTGDAASSLSINISKDKMMANVMMTRPEAGARTLDYEEILKFLERSGVTVGILFNNVKEIAEKEIVGVYVPIAQAYLPKDTKIIYHYKKQKTNKKVPLSSTQNADYRSYASHLLSIPAGGLIAEEVLIEESNLQAKNVFGESIDPSILENYQFFCLEAGTNVRQDPGTHKFYAEIGGKVLVDHSNPESVVLSVDPKLVISGDVDYSTGNIDFVGDIEITGDIKPGFHVKAGHNLKVTGVVDQAIIEAGNNIYLKKGINGGSIKTSQNVFATFIDRSRVKSKKDVIVSQEIINSHVTAYSSVLLTKFKSSIIGGKVIAGDLVVVSRLGSDSGQITNLIVGVNPDVQDTLLQLKAQEKKVLSNLSKMEKMSDRAYRMKADISKQRQFLAKIEEITILYQGKLGQIEEKIRKIEDYISNSPTSGAVFVKTTTYPGVNIKIKAANLNVKEHLQSKTFSSNLRKFRITPYKQDIVEDILSKKGFKEG